VGRFFLGCDGWCFEKGCSGFPFRAVRNLGSVGISSALS